MAKIKWELLKPENHTDNEVAIFRAEYLERSTAALLFAEVIGYWIASYDPVYEDDLTFDQISALVKEGKWVVNYNCRMPYAECETNIVCFSPAEVLDPDVMNNSFGISYSITVPLYDDITATHFKLKYG